MPFIRTSQIEDEVIYMPEHHLPNVRINRRSRRNSSLRRPRGSRCYQWLVLSLTLLSIVTCCMIIAVGFFFMEMSRGQLKPVVASVIACIDCTDDSYIPHRLLDAVSMRNIDGTSQCCAYNTKELTAVLEISVRRKSIVEAVPAFNISNFSLSSVSAHVQLLPPVGDTFKENKVVFTSDLVSILFNDGKIKSNASFEHARKILLLRNGFQVFKSGIYYVYSSIHFHVGPAIQCSDLKYKVWQHQIEKKNTNVALFKTSHTCCDDCNVDQETSYTGGAIKLVARDIIQIKISGYGLAFFNRNTSFAGLIMTGEED